ncbi:MAG: hypothetical protein O2803_07960 [Chloroflexi bacterium]|nr:hypothetical protein [Chloroflexota bacterium]
MTSEVMSDGMTARERISAEGAWEVAAFVERALRPTEGWLAAALLALNLVVVVMSVEQADWAPSPNLINVLFLAMLTGLLLCRIPVWTAVLLPAGVAVGFGIILWQLSTFSIEGVSVGGTGQVLERLSLWLEAARSGSINIDRLPFAFALMSATWLTGFLGAWLFLRYRNFWGVFVLGGIGLLSNLTFLPPNAAFHLGFYLFTALMVVGRVQSVRRKHEWERRSMRVDEHLGMLSFSDSFTLAVLVILVGFLLPIAPKWGVANNAYESMRSPLASMEDDFNRLFAGLPARRPLGFRIWDDVMALQGSIYPTTTQVLWVDSPAELYWKARTYNTYTGKGWFSEHTITEPLGYAPAFTSGNMDRMRSEVTYTVSPLYESKKLFTGDQVSDVDRDVLIETQAPPVFYIDVTRLRNGEPLPDYLDQLGDAILQAVENGGTALSDGELAQALPPQFRLESVEREAGRVLLVQVMEALPPVAEVLAVSAPEGKIKVGEAYAVTSAIPLATPEQLRQAGTEYPAWVSERYLQLPPTLPQRVRDLASQVADDESTPYGKAAAVEEYLQITYPYNLRVKPPPFNADSVDHFLFTLQEGYSEYFGSAMTIMLRTLGVPARLAVGYTTGDRVEGKTIFAVTDSHSHAWVEVYFPGFGWFPFEPTPGEALPDAYKPKSEHQQSGIAGQVDFDPFDEGCFDDLESEFCDEEAQSLTAFEASADGGWSSPIIGLWPWMLGAAGGLLLVSGSILWLWRRLLAVPNNPRLAFQRMTTLASLAAAGPADFQTPYQFGRQLQGVLPAQQVPVSIIVSAYVRSRFGNKTQTASERRLQAVAWRRLRLHLLWAVISRRVRG